jgi:hypothetical protein
VKTGQQKGIGFLSPLKPVLQDRASHGYNQQGGLSVSLKAGAVDVKSAAISGAISQIENNLINTAAAVGSVSSINTAAVGSVSSINTTAVGSVSSINTTAVGSVGSSSVGLENREFCVGQSASSTGNRTRSGIGKPPVTSQHPAQQQTHLSHSDRPSTCVTQSGDGVGVNFDAEEAKLRQEKIIRQKKRQTIRPSAGRWLLQKTNQPQSKLEDLGCAFKWRSYKQV